MTDRTTDRPSTTVYGYPRQGADRQLKKITEAYWGGRIDADALLAGARELRLDRLRELRDAGVGELPSNDFSLYDHVLDTAVMLGALPERHRVGAPAVAPAARLARYFALARGTAEVEPLEMTKWFTTNYHYLVPEIDPHTPFALDTEKVIGEFREAQEIGVLTRPVLLGPLSFLALAKPVGGAAGFAPLDRLEELVPHYEQILAELKAAGAEWVQVDEPVLAADQPASLLRRAAGVFGALCGARARPKILVATYFDRLGDALAMLAATPVEGLALDFVGRAGRNLETLSALGGVPDKRLVAGVVDGHNVWASDLSAALETLVALRPLARDLDVATSCSLLHVPLDVSLETGLDPAIKPWLAFARQKLDELSVLSRGLEAGAGAIGGALGANRAQLAARAASRIVRDPAVRERCASVGASDLHREHDHDRRRVAQDERLQLPLLPVTTIGSFPQTSTLRRARADLGAGRIDHDAYVGAMRAEIRAVVTRQEELGIDVLVHGEPERNDMVQYFAEQLDGFVATRAGWVQSYGTRYVRPPILVGDVSRPAPMTLSWATYAQSLTDRPVKGMLTGPVTMLAWSFVRDDQPLADTARQVALALRDEVHDLEEAGIAVIQVDEPALRETLPLRREDRAEYLAWALEAFRLSTSGVRDDTQIHTHMCYAEFGDLLDAIIEMDADVISLESARSQMAIVEDLARAGYPNEIGPGVWDIHSPRVPLIEEIAARLRMVVDRFAPRQLWVNPDCGLKTRDYAEVGPSLEHLVAAAALVRHEL